MEVNTMSRLHDFNRKAFIDKINLLNQIAVDGSDLEIAELIELSSSRSGDSTIDLMLLHTLRDLLLNNEAAAVRLLDSPVSEHQNLALGIVSRKKMQAAAPRLLALYQVENNPSQKNEMLRTMLELSPERFGELFRSETRNPDCLLAATAIKGLALCRDHSQDPYLQQLIRDNESPDRYHSCAVVTVQAIETLAELGGQDNLRFLSQSLHHKNPTVRRFIIEQLAQLGDTVIPYLTPIFSGDDNDQKILAANLIAQTNSKLGGDLLLTVLDQGQADDANVRFAVYEALGAFPSLKTFVCLIEALAETDHALLISVLTALNRYDFPFVGSKISERIDPSQPQGQAIIDALIDSQAEELIVKLSGQTHLKEAIQAARDRKSVRPQAGASILAADDSMAVRKFYESILSEAGYRVNTVQDGAAALCKLQAECFDLLITDLNMPNMDGIELAEKVRSDDSIRYLPIIMVTTETEQSQRNLAGKLNIDAYVNKPIRSELLLQTIQTLGI